MALQLTEPGKSASSSERGMVVGIDLGTTHTVVAFVKDKSPQIFSLEGESPLTPSTLSLNEEGYCVGQFLKDTLSSTKRHMGRAKHLPLGDQTLTPPEVASHILTHLKEKIEDHFKCPLEGAVITVPAYFDEAARVATKHAAALAGIKVLRLINEPTAAALAYGLETGAEGIYAIYDLGGGTFDFSLLNLQKGIFQVLATGGDLALGGDEIDQALANTFCLKDCREACKIKEALSKATTYQNISRDDLEKVADPLVQKTLNIVADVLHEANLSPENIKGVVLVGGMTRMPYVIKSVENFFKSRPLCDIDPDHAVALGASLTAQGLISGTDTLLLDVTPLSLGLETMGGLVEVILPRNTPVPALASQEFTTYEDGQGGMLFHVVQGEREFADDCISLARFELKGLPAVAAGHARVRVDFAVDAEGLLTVTAFEKTTSQTQHIEVHPTYQLDESKIKAHIQESQKHGREDIERRLASEAKAKEDYALKRSG